MTGRLPRGGDQFREDQFTWSYTGAACVAGLLLATVAAIAAESDVVVFWLVVMIGQKPTLIAVMAALAVLAPAIMNAGRGRWRRAASAAVAPVAAAGLFHALWATTGVTPERARDWLAFHATQHRYQARIGHGTERTDATAAPRFLVFPWRSRGIMGISNVDLLVFDESDELALAHDRRSAAWYARTAAACPDYILCPPPSPAPLAPEPWINAPHQKLGGHFYLVRQSW
jgi:hypothetical protein